MKTKLMQLSVMALALVSSVTLFGCSNNSEPKTRVAVEPSSAVQPVSASLDPRYEASLAEGIDFKKPGFPNFLAEVSGMSVPEVWGRWSDAGAGPVAKFRFKQPLPPKFTIEITANAFGPNLGEAIKVRVGGVEKSFVHLDASTEHTYSLVFESTNGADTIEIESPKPTSPAELKISGDGRKLRCRVRFP